MCPAVEEEEKVGSELNLGKWEMIKTVTLIRTKIENGEGDEEEEHSGSKLYMYI